MQANIKTAHLMKRKQILMRQLERLEERKYLIELAFGQKDAELSVINKMLESENKHG